MRFDWFGGKQPRRGGGGLVDHVSVATSSSARPAPPAGEALTAADRPITAVQLRRAPDPVLRPSGRFRIDPR